MKDGERKRMEQGREWDKAQDEDGVYVYVCICEAGWGGLGWGWVSVL